MEDRTRSYLRGRFGDHYRRVDVQSPPDADRREWGYIPWTAGPDTTMVRHKSLLDLGDLGEFLARERPRHVYYSAGRYRSPGAGTMEEKGWIDSDLVFDLDADHLPEVDLGEDTYAEMLAKCKTQLRRLLSFLERDFGFEQLSVVFSGGRGYHVHVRDPSVRSLASEERREIVDYVRGTGLDFEALTDQELVAGSAGRSSPAPKRTLPTDGGWAARAHDHVLARVDALLAMPEQDAIDALTEYDGIGERKAETALQAARANYDAIEAGNIDVHTAFYQVARRIAAEVVADRHAHIDEPVTTDTNRLIRLPGSIHGGSGLLAMPVPRPDLDSFEPTHDAVPSTFRGHEISVTVPESKTVCFDGETFTVEAGDRSLPEYQAVYLMCRGWAEKGAE
ncbi:MAG: DNA primase small subunit PriS [Halobacteriaceae archaeon]